MQTILKMWKNKWKIIIHERCDVQEVISTFIVILLAGREIFECRWFMRHSIPLCEFAQKLRVCHTGVYVSYHTSSSLSLVRNLVLPVESETVHGQEQINNIWVQPRLLPADDSSMNMNRQLAYEVQIRQLHERGADVGTQ